MPHDKFQPEILFEDNHCLAVNKPSRLLVGGDKTGDEPLLDLCRSYIAAHSSGKGYIAPLHFLDRPVSGVVLFAKSSKAASRLSAQFREGQMQKVYYAVVEAVPDEQEGELVDYLLKNRNTNIVKVVKSGTRDAKECVLGYRVMKSGGGLSLLEIKPQTGRSHQIRVQLSSRGWAIAGDVKYGSRIRLNGWIALHARSLTFEHPVKKEPVCVTAALPEEWQRQFRALVSRK